MTEEEKKIIIETVLKEIGVSKISKEGKEENSKSSEKYFSHVLDELESATGITKIDDQETPKDHKKPNTKELRRLAEEEYFKTHPEDELLSLIGFSLSNLSADMITKFEEKLNRSAKQVLDKVNKLTAKEQYLEKLVKQKTVALTIELDNLKEELQEKIDQVREKMFKNLDEMKEQLSEKASIALDEDTSTSTPEEKLETKDPKASEDGLSPEVLAGLWK